MEANCALDEGIVPVVQDVGTTGFPSKVATVEVDVAACGSGRTDQTD